MTLSLTDSTAAWWWFINDSSVFVLCLFDLLPWMIIPAGMENKKSSYMFSFFLQTHSQNVTESILKWSGGKILLNLGEKNKILESLLIFPWKHVSLSSHNYNPIVLTSQKGLKLAEKRHVFLQYGTLKHCAWKQQSVILPWGSFRLVVGWIKLQNQNINFRSAHTISNSYTFILHREPL